MEKKKDKVSVVFLQLAMMFEHAQYGPPIVESDPLPPVEELPA